MQVIEARVDQSRVVEIMRRAGQLPLVKEYLLGVQKNNLSSVNEAINQLLVEEEDWNALRDSITTYDNFDQLELAASLESHALTEFRRIAALIYKKNLKWKKAVALAKADKLYKDAMETVSQSEDADLAEDLLRFFIDENVAECFAACLYTCYDLIRPDVALELAWKNKLMDFVMPYMIQCLKDYSTKIDLLMKDRREAQEASKAGDAERKAQEQAANAYLQLNSYLALPSASTNSQTPNASNTFGGLPQL